MLKPKKAAIGVGLAIFGAGYLATISSFDISIFLRGYVAIVPIQAAILIYLWYSGYFKRPNKLKL
jgi:hypothetical protein